jgi:Uma2 family endonuclease
MVTATITEGISLEEFLANPLDHMEWVDGQLLEKTGMTLRHSIVQSRLDGYWRNHKNESGQGGEVLVELACRTLKQGRRPDVCYITAELLEQFSDVGALPQSPTLIGEIASPDDSAEDLFAKTQEYLESGCEEVWLVFPETRRVLVLTKNQTFGYSVGDVVSTQLVLLGFSVAADEFLA